MVKWATESIDSKQYVENAQIEQDGNYFEYKIATEYGGGEHLN